MSYADRADPDCEHCKGRGYTIRRPPSPPFFEMLVPCRCLKPITTDPVKQALAYIRSRYGPRTSGWSSWRV